MKIFVQTQCGQTHALEVNPHEIIESIKIKIVTKLGWPYPPEEQRLLFESNSLENKKSLADYEIHEESKLTLVLRLRGQGHESQLIEPRFHYLGRTTIIDVPLINENPNKKKLELDLNAIKDFIQIVYQDRHDKEVLFDGTFSIVSKSTEWHEALQTVQWQSSAPMPRCSYDLRFVGRTNAMKALQESGWKVGYDGKYQVENCFRDFADVRLHFTLELKTRHQTIRCLSDDTAKTVKLAFNNEDQTDPYYTLMECIAEAWNLSTEDIESIMVDEVIIEDEYDVVQLKPSDVITFRRIYYHILPFEYFKIKTQIGKGCWGIVTLAELRGRNVALKQYKFADVTNDDIVSRSNRFINIWHKHLISAIGVTIDPNTNTSFIVMHYTPDGSLEDLLSLYRESHQGLSKISIVRIALDVAKGLLNLHWYGIIHYNLKCSNAILYDGKTRAKLTDYWTSEIVSKRSKAKIDTGMIGLVAPEVLQEMPCDFQADVYSFGGLLYQMITMTPLPMIFLETAREKKIKSDVKDKSLQKLITECCKTEPSQRPTIEKCIDELKQMLTKLNKQ